MSRSGSKSPPSLFTVRSMRSITESSSSGQVSSRSICCPVEYANSCGTASGWFGTTVNVSCAGALGGWFGVGP